MPGRRPKPTADKIRMGNPGHRDLNDQEPQFDRVAPECPRGLHIAAQREWDFLVPILLKRGILTSVDGKALAEYCKAYSIAELAYADMTKNGLVFDNPVLDNENQPIWYDGGIVTVRKGNPAVTIWKTAATIMKAYLIEFGLTPATRAKLKAVPVKEVDPMEANFSKRPGMQKIDTPAPSYFDAGELGESETNFDA